MEKETIEIQTVSFNEVKTNIVIDNDDYNIAHEGMREQLVNVIFSGLIVF